MAGTLLAPLALGSQAAEASTQSAQQRRVSTVLSWARKELGKPYRYGGTGPGSFDCSGFTQFVYRKAGVRLPRTAAQQYRGVRHKVSWKNLQPGDLVFFSGLGHVGLVSKRQGGRIWMIHSPHPGDHVRQAALTSAWKHMFYGAVQPF